MDAWLLDIHAFCIGITTSFWMLPDSFQSSLRCRCKVDFIWTTNRKLEFLSCSILL